MDMTTGSLPKKMVQYALPFMATGALQLMFNMADVVVVGRFAGHEALAAVGGSTGTLINLIINLFMGLSVGVSVLISQYYGADNREGVSQTVHTAACVSLVCGLILAVFGVLMARPLLAAMGSPDDVIDLAALYLRIYFLGAPVLLIYNFLSAVLRAVGDTKRPLVYLSISGVVNVALNLLLVIVFDLGVAGVAIATVVSETISTYLVVQCLRHSDGCYRLQLRRIKINGAKLRSMIQIGLPAGIQGSLFSISNVIIQSHINAFGSLVIAGNTAAQNVEGFTYIAMNSIAQTAMAFTGQNTGAGNAKNLRTVLWFGTVFVTVVGITLGGLSCLFSQPLLHIFSPEETVVQNGALRMLYLCLPYFLLGISDVFVGMMRGMGYSLCPMLLSIGGICGLRLAWIYIMFPLYPTLSVIYLSYGISWVVTLIMQAVALAIVLHKVMSVFNAKAERSTV